MIYTFYSYKGGVGRTMALANVAELFYQAGLKVLMIDWDLEAPGLERYFPSIDLQETLGKPGIIDMLLHYKEQMAQKLDKGAQLELERLDNDKYKIDVYLHRPGLGKLFLITAGQRDEPHFADYARSVLTFDWQDFYNTWEGARYFEWLRQEFEKIADVVLIDSRTGVTEMGGVCTHQLGDVVVMFCSTNQQNLHGTYQIARNLKNPEVQKLRGDRPLHILIIPARVEDRAESELLNEFKHNFIERLSPFLPISWQDEQEVFSRLKIPHIPYFAFKELVAVREKEKHLSEDLIRAFVNLVQEMRKLAPQHSPLNQTISLKIKPQDMVKPVHMISTSSKKIRLFLCAPPDVECERQRIPVVAAQINRILGDRLNCHLEVIDWKTYVAPDMGRPQEVINRQIAGYDIFVGIMWKRFGTPTGQADLGTEEEFNIAYANWQRFNRPRILFYFSHAPYTPKSGNEMDQWKEVLEFKSQLRGKGLIFEFQTPDEFVDLLREHLAGILQEWFPSEGKTQPIADFSYYLNYLKKDTMYMDIRGLVTGEGRAHQFSIDQLYIPLKTTGAGLVHEEGKIKGHRHIEKTTPREASLQEILQEPKLIIKGDPGAGKTTFLKLITYTLCRKWLGEGPASGPAGIIWPESPPLPIFIRLGKLIAHINDKKEKDPALFQAQEADLAGLFHFLETQSKECNWRLTGDIFCREMEAGHALILLDGLDEAPDPKTREKVSALAERICKSFPGCRVVLTSRPAALIGSAAVPPGFSLVEIAPLDEQAMKAFLAKWSAALYFDAPEKSSGHRQELWEALQARPEIRRMAKTPVMLTALAVVHWNENRLPEQRAELYESIITWLLRAREQRASRLNTDQCRKLLQLLALAMFTAPEGRLRQVGLRRAAEMLADEFIPAGKNIEKEEAGIKRQAIERAGRFLEDEMVDSGIIVKRGNELEFWHLSFQEYLAAYEIAGLLDNERLELLFKKERFYSIEWREPALLLGGVLYKQGKERINHLIDAIIKRGPEEATQKNLPQLAREAGLLGGIVRDLSPFDFQPKNPAYPEVFRKVMGIFDKSTYRGIPVQVRIEAADALGQVGNPRLEGDSMIAIQGGVFWMGAQKKENKERHYDPDAYNHESPVHQVELSPFFMSAYPITVGQYRRFIEDGGYEDKRLWGAGSFGQFKAPDKWEDQLQYPSRPVVEISWYEAAAYARWASGRLPTEAEWERAARGPGRGYRKYTWGNKYPTAESANFGKSKVGHITPVGIFPEDCSLEGVIDLAGNVWEWCSDWFSDGYYQTCTEQGLVTDPPGPAEGNARVVRGGAYVSDPDDLRCADRLRGGPDYRNAYLGFRMVRGAHS